MKRGFTDAIGTALTRMMLKAAASIVCLGVAEFALATPPSDTGVQTSNYALVIDPDATDRVQINLPTASEYEEDAPIGHGTRSPSIFLFQVFTAHPNSSTGWHYHPGIVLATVVEGSVDWYDADCKKHVHKAGDFYIENGYEIHMVQNSGSVPAREIITYIIAKGITYKISIPAPACATALGLH